MWSLEVSLAVTVTAVIVITVAGRRLVGVADEVADRTGAGEALIGASLLGATTSLADITAVVSASVNDHASMAVSAAVGGIAVQTAFLAVADRKLGRVNLEHAAASMPNLISVSMLIFILSLVLIASLGPQISIWQVHPVTLILFCAYLGGLKLVQKSKENPMWQPRVTKDTRADVEDDASPRPWSSIIATFIMAGGAVAAAGWSLSEAGSALMEHLGLTETAVGGTVIAIGTSLPELVTSVAAVQRGALTLAVGGIIGGNAFDTVMVGIADIAYRGGSIYQTVEPRDLALVGITISMSAVLLMGLLYRQRVGPARIGLDGVLILSLYVLSLVIINVRY